MQPPTASFIMEVQKTPFFQLGSYGRGRGTLVCFKKSGGLSLASVVKLCFLTCCSRITAREGRPFWETSYFATWAGPIGLIQDSCLSVGGWWWVCWLVDDGIPRMSYFNNPYKQHQPTPFVHSSRPAGSWEESRGCCETRSEPLPGWHSKTPTTKTTHVFVTFLGWLSDPFKG